MSELNPNHPVTKTARDHWHKIAAIIMVKLGRTEIEITEPDIQRLEGKNIVLDERGKKLVVRIVNDEEARRLLQQEVTWKCNTGLHNDGALRHGG